MNKINSKDEIFTKNKFPMRVNKYLAQKGVDTRRGVDTLIMAKRVFINNNVAILGDKVNESDTVKVLRSGKPVTYKYFAYYKPRGVITHSPQSGEKDIREDITKIPETANTNIFPVGRLDKDSYGLIILTNDGRITDRLLNPDKEHEKEYRVTTTKRISNDFLQKIASGVDIGGYVTRTCKVERESGRVFRIVLSEGKKHQIRRMVSALKNDVETLERIRIMNITVQNLKPGNLRPIKGDDLSDFLKSLGL
ncbi:MAG TPA: rRNA pseudouridine synthase [Candidatus Kaiserbacteria bacterium]|nr:rRNA pseudouridine synthase [Candidatus Kaiserbacteria bacterium]